MRKLLIFLTRYSIVGLFLLLEIVSFALFVGNERYPKSVFFSSGNAVISGLYSISSHVTDFFKLRSNNQELCEENARLKNRITLLENRLALEQAGLADTTRFVNPEKETTFVSARIIHNTTNRLRNYITLNRGASDGIRPDMGVVGPQGVVGIVRSTSERFSTVISLLNPIMQVNCKIKRNNYNGLLRWNGKDYRYAQLTDIPRHVSLYIGDTIVTSGLTTTFPEGIPVGVIENFMLDEGDAFYSIQVKLATDFRSISNVNIINYKNRDEQRMLENLNESDETR